jgi:hypothetical protein
MSNVRAYSDITRFLHEELHQVEHPLDPGQTHRFDHTGELVELLIQFLLYPVADEDVARLPDKVLSAFEAFRDRRNAAELAQAIDDIATGFERLLKKIACVRYAKDPLSLRGDGVQYAGLLKTTLGGLLLGLVGKTNPRDRSIPDLRAPVVTFTTGGTDIRSALYEYARRLRNDIHLAKS